jgi:hypothetical protein
LQWPYKDRRCLLLLPPIIPITDWSSQKDTYLMDPVAIDILQSIVYNLTLTLHLQLPGSYVVCMTDNIIDHSFLPEMTLVMPDLQKKHTSYVQFQIGHPRMEIEQLRKHQTSMNNTKTNEERIVDRQRRTPSNDNFTSSNTSFSKEPVGAISPKLLQHVQPPLAQLSQNGTNKASIQLLHFLSTFSQSIPTTADALFERGNNADAGIVYQLDNESLKTTNFSMENEQDKKNVTLTEKTRLRLKWSLEFFWKKLKKMLTTTFGLYEPLTTSVGILLCITCFTFSLLLLSTFVLMCQMCYDFYGKHENRHRQHIIQRHRPIPMSNYDRISIVHHPLKLKIEEEEEKEELEYICNKDKLLTTTTELKIDNDEYDNNIKDCNNLLTVTIAKEQIQLHLHSLSPPPSPPPIPSPIYSEVTLELIQLALPPPPPPPPPPKPQATIVRPIRQPPLPSSLSPTTKSRRTKSLTNDTNMIGELEHAMKARRIAMKKNGVDINE